MTVYKIQDPCPSVRLRIDRNAASSTATLSVDVQPLPNVSHRRGGVSAPRPLPAGEEVPHPPLQDILPSHLDYHLTWPDELVSGHAEDHPACPTHHRQPWRVRILDIYYFPQYCPLFHNVPWPHFPCHDTYLISLYKKKCLLFSAIRDESKYIDAFLLMQSSTSTISTPESGEASRRTSGIDPRILPPT